MTIKHMMANISAEDTDTLYDLEVVEDSNENITHVYLTRKNFHDDHDDTPSDDLISNNTDGAIKDLMDFFYTKAQVDNMLLPHIVICETENDLPKSGDSLYGKDGYLFLVPQDVVQTQPNNDPEFYNVFSWTTKNNITGYHKIATTELNLTPIMNLISSKIDTAGTGLSKNGTTLNHTNGVTEQSSTVFKKIKYDAQGHITGTADVEDNDLPEHTHDFDSVSYTPGSIASNTPGAYTIGTLEINDTQYVLYGKDIEVSLPISNSIDDDTNSTSKVPSVKAVEDYVNGQGFVTSTDMGVNLNGYIQTSQEEGLIKNDGTIDTNNYLTEHQPLTNYIQKLDTSGLIKNDGTIDTTSYLSESQETEELEIVYLDGTTKTIDVYIKTSQ